MPFAKVNDHLIHFLDTEQLGDEIQDEKVPIVMVHGLGSSQNYYVPILPQLTVHRCVALSSYGAAQSKSHGEKLSLEALADDVVGLMDHLKMRRAVVVGHSMGGPIVLHIAATYPDRVSGVVCIGPVNPSTVNPDIFKARIETVLRDGMEPLANTVPQAATNAKSTSLQRAMIRELLIGQDPKSYASHCDVIVNLRDPGFAAIKAPVLIVAGDEDKSAPLEGCEIIYERLGSPQKELKVLKGVGHWHCIEAADEVGRAVRSFASKLQ